MRIDELKCNELEKHVFRVIKRIGKELCASPNKMQFINNESFLKKSEMERRIHPSEGKLENLSYWVTDFLCLPSGMGIYWASAWHMTELYNFVKKNPTQFKESDIKTLKKRMSTNIRCCMNQRPENLICKATKNMQKSYGLDRIFDAIVEIGEMTKENGEAIKETMYILYDEGLYDKLPL